MKINWSGCAARPGQTPARYGSLADVPSRQAELVSRLRHAFVSTLAVAGLIALTGLATPARAERGLEWEPGGMLYKYLDRYDGRPRSKHRAKIRTQTASYHHDEDETESYHDGGYDEETVRPRRRAAHRKARRTSTRRRRKISAKQHTRRKRVRVASLGGGVSIPQEENRPRRSVTGGSEVNWVASSGCLNTRLRAAINHVAQNYGRVRVNSTCRSRRHNRRVGGARRSWHLSGNAADIRIWGNVRAAARYLRSVAGGYKHYGGGLFHIDTGPRRTW